MHETREVAISAIAIRPDRLRALRPEAVAALARSMTEQGQLQPVVLRQRDEAGYWLIAGRHRIAAATELKWETIRASIFDTMTGDQAELAEIDENLIRADLSPAERAAHITARKIVYERINPNTVSVRVRGGPGRGRPSENESQNATSFIDDTAKTTGRDRSTIAREAKRGKDIPNVSKLAGTSLDRGDELDALAKLSETKRDELITRATAGEKVSAKTEAKKERRDSREKILGACQMALPNKRYGVILADPEWRFEVYSRDTGMDRAADNHYPTSATDAICARPVGDIAADDCVLFLWATAPMMPDAEKVMAAWGFEYKSQAIWKKDRIGTGYWFRNAHELLLVGTRGAIPAPAMGTQFASVIEAPVGVHSAKPEVFLEMIESYFPTLPKIELNRRGAARPGWDAWGNEADDGSPTDPITGEIQEASE